MTIQQEETIRRLFAPRGNCPTLAEQYHYRIEDGVTGTADICLTAEEKEKYLTLIQAGLKARSKNNTNYH